MTQDLPDIIEASNGIILHVHLKPRSKNNNIIGVRNGSIVLRVQATPVQEKANTACVKFFASFLGLPSSSCKLISGQHAKEKRILLNGISKDNFLNMWNNCLSKE